LQRRNFLATLGAVGAYAPRLAGEQAPTVRAESTVFFASDGERNLVRFTVSGLDAPAGRLRVYDRRSRLIGTAGVINTGEVLVGELWLRLEQDLTLTSELEAPGLNRVHRTTHRVPQGLRWTIHWLVVADPHDVQRVIGTGSPLANALRSSIVRAAQVQINPLGSPRGVTMDPIEALDPFRRAQHLAAFGFPTSRVAYQASANRLDQTQVMALAGAGVHYVIRPWEAGATYEWWDGLDGSHVLAIPRAPNGDLASLGFDDTSATAQSRVDQWLAESPIHLAPLDARGRETNDRITYIIDTDVERAPARKLAIDDWNSRFGFPRLVMGAPSDPLDVAHQSRESIPSIRFTHAADASTTSTGSTSNGTRRSANLLAAVLTNGRRGVEAVAADIRTEFPGTVVFNGGPFPRTDVMVVAGQRQIVTNIPAHGYAFLPDLGEESPPPRPGSNSPVAQSARHRLRLNDRDGSIDSIVDRESALEWVGEGMNVIDGARLDRLTQDVLPGMGIRMVAERQVPRVGRVRSTIELLDMVPWVSIRNEPMSGDGMLETRFQFASFAVEALWDRGFGHHQSTLPTPAFEFGRWVWLRGDVNGYFWSTTRQAHVTQSSTLISRGDAAADFRVMADSLPASAADAARFGWRTIDLLQHKVSPNLNGRLPRFGSLLRLPRFGSLLELDQPSAAIIAIEPDDPFATSVTVYVQDLLGASRMLGIEKGLLDFDDAEVVDYLGQPTDRTIEPNAAGVQFLTPRFGITAVRLRGLQLREG